MTVCVCIITVYKVIDGSKGLGILHQMALGTKGVDHNLFGAFDLGSAKGTATPTLRFLGNWI